MLRMFKVGAAVLAAAAFTALGLVGGATATKMVTGRQVANGTLTGADLKRGSVTLDRLTPAAQALVRRGGKPGAPGQPGQPGSPGQTGSPGQAGQPGRDGVDGASGRDGAQGWDGASGSDGRNGAAGHDGAAGADGAAGRDGANPATPVRVSGDGGWTVSGVNAEGDSAKLVRGALHVPGGFDGSTPQGAIGLVKAYAMPLSQLSALGYRFTVNKRAAGDLDQPTVHVTVEGAVQGVDSKFATGFTNLVCNPHYNDLDGLHDAVVDCFADGNRWYSTGADAVSAPTGGQSHPISIQELIARNPDATVTQVSVDNGGSSGGSTASGDTDFSIDDVIVGVGSSFERYDLGG